ncbi:unnamed protein product [Orchesella dallaii]|uniref:Folate transporter 1 n=1 Tax=Orchesella dallaii TaxID=48710 RepID=A0ABP1S2R5_9HEXA
MEVGWKRTAFVMCGVGLFKEFLPSAPFFIEYAMDSDHGSFTKDEITREILPVTIYGHFVSLLIFLLITDLLRYRPIIILGGLSAMLCWTITIYSYHTKKDAIIRQILYSIEHSSEVAYITFMYEIVNRTLYREVTSLIHGSMHAGKFIGGALGQILLSYKILSLENINYFSLGSTFSLVTFAMFMPGIKWTLYCHPRVEDSSTDLEKADSEDWKAQEDGQSTNSSQDPLDPSSPTQVWGAIKHRFGGAYSELKKDIVSAYSNDHVRRWSVWWAMSRAIYWQIALYTESLWKEIEEETHQHPLNGAVDAAHALISMLLAASLPFIKIPWEMWAERYLTVIALVQGFMTLWMSQTKDLYIANICYVIVQTTFEVVFIFGASEIAGSLPDHKASFIFGINALMGILIQALITNVVTTSYSFALDIRSQFFVYGCYSIGLSLLFLTFALRKRHKTWKVNTPLTRF